jgi:hypothetical protein
MTDARILRNRLKAATQMLKQRALDRTTPPGIRLGRYRPPGSLLAFLEQLS